MPGRLACPDMSQNGIFPRFRWVEWIPDSEIVATDLLQEK